MSSIVLFHADLMFSSKIKEAAAPFGLEIRSVRDAKSLKEIASSASNTLLLVDLNSTRTDPFELIEEAGRVGIKNLACFFSHVDSELAERAERLGVTAILPRSAFVKELPRILSNLST